MINSESDVGTAEDNELSEFEGEEIHQNDHFHHHHLEMDNFDADVEMVDEDDNEPPIDHH